MSRDNGTGRRMLNLLRKEVSRITQEVSKRLPVIPALISWTRILAVPAVLIVINRLGSLRLLFWIVLACGISDYLDGWLARHTGSVSYAGKVLDFTADKLFLSVILLTCGFSLNALDPISAGILFGYHLLILLALSVISWSIRIPVVTITTGERLAVLFSYLLAIISIGRLAFPGKHIYSSLLWPMTVIAILSALTGLLSYLRLLRRFMSRLLELRNDS